MRWSPSSEHFVCLGECGLVDEAEIAVDLMKTFSDQKTLQPVGSEGLETGYVWEDLLFILYWFGYSQ